MRDCWILYDREDLEVNGFFAERLRQCMAFCFAKNRLSGVSLSLQPLPSLRSVQWPPSAPLLSLPRFKTKNSK